jgi:sodium-dependent phosphate cotransporter
MVSINESYGEDEHISWGSFFTNCASSMKERSAKDWMISIGRMVGVVCCLYFFLFSLDLMGGAFKVLGGCSAGGLFEGASNPIAGLMIGILATVLVQSSSTSTSIVVSMVGAGQMSVDTAVFVVMGANIGTSVTNTIVSMGQVNDKDQFERAFAGATVHDMFNFLAVIILLPLEAATGMLVALTSAMKPTTVSDGDDWEGPIKQWVGPFTKLFLSVNKSVIKDLSLKKATCEETYAKVAKMDGPCGDNGAVGLIKCACNDDGTIKFCPAFYTNKGSLSDDMAAGGVALALSLIFLCLCLVLMVKLLQSMVLGTSTTMLRKATSLNGYIAMIIGIGVTILVQSSSVTTSVLTPLVGVGVLPVEKMFPLTLGANIGTTMTAILASLVSSKPEAVQIALCHLFFNLIGILIWYPIPFMRRVPINAAKSLGFITRRYRLFPLIYIFVAFAAIPGLLLGVSILFEKGGSYIIIGILVVVALSGGLIFFIFWWFKRDGKEKFLGYLERRQHRADVMKNLPHTIAALQEQVKELVEKKGKLMSNGSDNDNAKKPSTDVKEAFLVKAESKDSRDPPCY